MEQRRDEKIFNREVSSYSSNYNVNRHQVGRMKGGAAQSPDGGEFLDRKFLSRSRTLSFDGMIRRHSSLQDKSPINYHHSHHSSLPLSHTSEEYVEELRDHKRSHSAQDPGDQANELQKLLRHPQTLYSDSSNGNTMMQQKQHESQSNLHQQQLGNPINEKKNEVSKGGFLYYFMYAVLNTMMAVPSLYGYASVIFNHDVFQPHIATLSKLVIWSSGVHQMVFCIISSISFAKAEVQDAGLLFLSVMSHFIAEQILNDDGSIEEIISTTIVTLSIATASLGIILMLMGRFHCADAVSYLPLPVVGGYLAYIGYFCVIAGVGLCISKSMIGGGFLSDMQLLMQKEAFILAFPGLIAGAIMMLVARYAQSDITLPLTMIIIPSIFYTILYATGTTLDEARESNWVGQTTPPSSISVLFELFDLGHVRWALVLSQKCVTVWVGMVFVVSFSSCLDVAAISMDMGEPLDVNKELITVGLSNLVSGLLLGQSGSYIFSTTILTYRTGFHSRWIGFIGALMFLAVVISKVNLLEIAPLFFLGSTLIFIGIDLLYEWIVEVYHRLLLSEYIVLVATFVAIQFVGIDGGIILGVIVAVVEYVVTTSQVSSLRRVLKRSRAIWNVEHRKLLREKVYDSLNPKIVSLEITETVFFGSSLLLFSHICDEIGISASPTDMHEIILASPGLVGSRSPAPLRHRKQKRQNSYVSKKKRPRYVVLDLTQVANVDASAARTCFLQLAKMCAKNGIILCAAGANRRVDWMLRSHDVSYTTEEEDIVKGFMLNPFDAVLVSTLPSGKLILFPDMNDCLELCENQLIYEYEQSLIIKPPKLGHSISNPDLFSQQKEEVEVKTPLSVIVGRMLGLDEPDNQHILESFDPGGIAEVDEQEFHEGAKIFSKNEVSDSFFVVLSGCVGVCKNPSREAQKKRMILPPLGKIQKEEFPDVLSYVSVGGVFGYVDFALERRRSFNVICQKDGTVVAKLSRRKIDWLKRENEVLYHIIEKVLLQASLMELANAEVS
mmetsp:Transcript_4349/g.5009  ORF Transcript_4349/g.5009 Transcript_4349/m.5009 type:complete len:1009 (+) Transcript_4349:92-3118(+)